MGCTMGWNLITIVVPAYNIEKTLPRCLESVLAQSYENLEVIVVNDGSSDGTAAIIDGFAARDSRVRAIHKENGGVTSARLRGVAEATGDYIGFVDGDDYIEPQMYARLLENLHAHRADISHCGYRMVFPSRVDWYYNTGKLTVQEGRQGLYDLLEGGFVEPALWNKLYRRELFVGLSDWMDSSIRINEDLLMNYYLFRQAKCAVHEDVCPYHYILRKGSATVSRLTEHKLKDPLQVVDTMLRQEQDPTARQILENRMVYQLIGGTTMALGQQKELIGPWRKQCRTRLRGLVPLKGSHFSRKMEIMALWAAIWPRSYWAVHKLYARIRGTDKKYEVK